MDGVFPQQRKQIVLTGAHGTGKTTLAKALQAELVAAGVSAIRAPEAPRVICDKVADPHFFRSSQNSPLRQFLIFVQHLHQEVLSATAPVQILDRGLLDHWVYTLHFHREVLSEEGVLEPLEQIVAAHSRGYEALYYLPIEFSPVDDGIRESDASFQKAVDSAIFDFLQRHQIPVTTLSGSVKDRVAKVLEHHFLAP